LNEIEKPIATIEAQRLRITRFDSRAQYFAFVHKYYSLYIQILMELARIHSNEAYREKALEAAERSKVRALLDQLTDSEPSAPCDLLIADERDGVTSVHSRTVPEISAARPLTYAELQTQVSDDTVIVEYSLGDSVSYAWVIDGPRILAHKLPPAAEIEKQVLRLRNALMPASADSSSSIVDYLARQNAAKRVRAEASRWLGMVLLKALELPVSKRVVIVPDGALQYVPFAALISWEAASGSGYFVTQHEISLLPSFSALAAIRATANRRAPPEDSVAVYAGPVFARGVAGKDSKGGMQVAGRRAGMQPVASLPGSLIEAHSIQKIFGPEHVRLAIGFDATRESVLSGWLADQRIIHFATHGVLDTRNPEKTGLILSLVNPQGGREDGLLRIADIYNLKLSADLVVLSACDSGLGKDLQSEGIIGLPRGFLYAGAKTVIASLWKVDDEATSILMQALYLKIKKGETPGAALRFAQLELSRDRRYSDPYYWAAFQMEGEYR